MILRKSISTLLILLFCQISFGQETVKNIDSLLVVLKTAQNDTTKVQLYQKISGHYNVTHLDSAKAFAEKGIELAKQLEYPLGQWINLNTLGNYYERKTNYPEALKQYNLALDIIKKINSTKGFAVVLNNIATIHIKKGEYDEALRLMFEALKAEEKLNNQNGVAQAYNNIGIIYYYIQDFDKTTHYLKRALEIQEELGNFDGLINGYNNIGAIRIYQEKYQEAIVTYEKALSISIKIDDKMYQAVALSNIAICWTKMKKYIKAEEFFEQSLAIRDEIKDFDGKANSLVNMGELFFKQKKYNKAEKYVNQGLEIAKKHNLKKVKETGFAHLSEIYEAKGNYKKANVYLMEFLAVKDSLLNENNAKIIAEVETKYETEKKEKEILEQQIQLVEKDKQVSQKNYVIFGSLALAFILGLLGYLFYNQQKLKNTQLQKEGELKTALAKIETQNKLQEQRLRISRDLHDNIGAQLTFIISSIDNLKYGFSDIGEKLSTKLTGISFFTTQTIYELRDTIWAMNKTNITFEDLQGRIANFIDNAKKASEKTAFSFKIASGVNQHNTFTSVQGMNIYRIIQEAVNNSLKYSEASKVSVEIKEENSNYRIIINDNGNGFNIDEVKLGNGLNNMKKRAHDLGGEVAFNSKLGEGTTVTLILLIY